MLGLLGLSIIVAKFIKITYQEFGCDQPTNSVARFVPANNRTKFEKTVIENVSWINILLPLATRQLT